MTRNKLFSGLCFMTLLTLSACQEPYHGPANVNVVSNDDKTNSDVNASYGAGRLDIPSPAIPTLQNMENIQASDIPEMSKKTRMREPQIRSAALAYGSQGGLAYASKQINGLLEEQAPRLQKIYDFNQFIIHEGDAKILPPVIVESDDTYEQSDAGSTLRVADKYYKIIQQATFAPVAPLWHSYLYRKSVEPKRPQEDNIPRNEVERGIWRKYVAEGWDSGVKQAKEIFKLDLRRLDRDRNGMILFNQLLDQGLVSPPVIADQSLGTTGSGQDMRVNDKAYRLTSKPRLLVERPDSWNAAVSNEDATDASTPPGKTPGDSGNGY